MTENKCWLEKCYGPLEDNTKDSHLQSISFQIASKLA